MRLEEAVKILNEGKYHYVDWLFGDERNVEWVVNLQRTRPTNLVLVNHDDRDLGVDKLDEFTAIAVAEKYLREIEIAKNLSMANRDRCHHYISASNRFRCKLEALHEGEHVFTQEEFK